MYNDNDGTYGSPRVYHELKAQGVACSENRVARLMRLRGLKAKQTRRYKSTTKRNKAHPVAPNLLKRNFVADQPDQTWLADITDEVLFLEGNWHTDEATYRERLERDFKDVELTGYIRDEDVRPMFRCWKRGYRLPYIAQGRTVAERSRGG